MNVTKVVDIFTRNIEQLSLHFFQIFYKFLLILQVHCFWKTKRIENETLHRGPWEDLGACNPVPGRTWSRGGGRRQKSDACGRWRRGPGEGEDRGDRGLTRGVFD